MDQIISWETAKLAKEKGFNIPVSRYYRDEKLIVNLSNQSGDGFTIDGTTDKITYLGSETRISRKVNIIVKPLPAYLTIPYKISIYNNGDLFSEVEGLGNTEAIIESPITNSVQFKVQSTSEFQFTTSVGVVK